MLGHPPPSGVMLRLICLEYGDTVGFLLSGVCKRVCLRVVVLAICILAFLFAEDGLVHSDRILFKSLNILWRRLNI